MILKLNATGIIACAVDKHLRFNNRKNSMKIRINHLQTVARKMEEEVPTLLTDCDMIAIEDCQSIFRNNIIIGERSIQITHLDKISSIMKRYRPSHDEIYAKVIEKV